MDTYIHIYTHVYAHTHTQVLEWQGALGLTNEAHGCSWYWVAETVSAKRDLA